MLEVVASRLRAQKRDDSARVALVIEGGGMRGVVSAAMAAQLEIAGVSDAVDLVVGTSAGAATAFAVSVGRATELVTAYQDTFCAPGYFDARRVVQGRPALDGLRIIREVDELLDLDPRSRRAGSPQPVFVATDVDRAEAVPLTDFVDHADALFCLQASSHLPLLGGRPLAVRGRRWMDGGIAEAVPLHAAAALGATHAIVLATRSVGPAGPTGWSDAAVARYLRSINPSLSELYRQRALRRHLDLSRAMLTGAVDGMLVYVSGPRSGDPLPGRTQRDPVVSQQASHAAAGALRAGLEGTALAPWLSHSTAS